MTQTIIATFDTDDLEAITRNLETLYGTVVGTCPLDRNFGLSQDYLSYPTQVAENLLALDIIEKTEIYEPRVKVKQVAFDHDSDTGQLIPTITLERGE